MTRFPWDEAMRFGFGVLQLSSREFWGLSPRELSAAFEARSGRASRPLQREHFGDLMQRYPDEESKSG